MKNLDHLFLPYELAVIAKEKGFNEPCIVSYEDYDEKGTYQLHPLVNFHDVSGINSSIVNHTICAPIYQQIIDWFRQEHSIEAKAISWREGGKIIYLYSVHSIGTEKSTYRLEFISNTYYEALNKEIQEAFKLI